MAERIQRCRAAGYRSPTGAVYVGRPTLFGNPFAGAEAARMGLTVEQCVDVHRSWLGGNMWILDVITFNGVSYDRRVVLASLHLLAGRDLACWCAPPEPGGWDVCHGATLLELAASIDPVPSSA